MRVKFFTVISIFFILNSVVAQTGPPSLITSAELSKIRNEVDKEAINFKQKLGKDIRSEEIAFQIDTFKINHFCSKKMEIDYSTAGMNNATLELTASYDKLMNKYYNLLLQALKTEDKKILQAAQRSWLSFRDNESKLIGLLRFERYSGGGTIQFTISTSRYSELTIQRTEQLFEYYSGIYR